MRSYFRNHPTIDYNGQQVRNLMLNAQLTKSVLGDTTTFLPYTVQEGDTPTTVAFDYYGHIDWTWLVLLSNSIIDPYTGWVKTQEQFDNSIIKQYGSLQTAYSTNHHYINPYDTTLPPVSIDSNTYLAVEDKVGLVPVYAYEYEFELNERKRLIKLVDKTYAPRIALELEKKLSQ